MKEALNESYPAFEWDPEKARRNIKKHGIDFMEASYVFADRLNITIHDSAHSGRENRWVTIGKVSEKIIIVVHTYPNEPSESPIRIISARLAKSSEIRYYQEGE